MPVVYLCELSSSLGKCYWLFPIRYTGTEKTFTLTWQNLSRRRQWVLHLRLGTMSWAGTNHFFGTGREITGNNWWCFINNGHGLPSFICNDKPTMVCFAVNYCSLNLYEKQANKNPLHNCFFKEVVSISSAWSKTRLHHGYQDDFKKQHRGKVEGKASTS